MAYLGTGCLVCGTKVYKINLCSTHYYRHYRHGHFETTRPADWGQKSKHPLWERWKSQCRVGIDDSWKDFWIFVKDVGDIPPDSTLRRLRISDNWGPNNFEWVAYILEGGATREKKAQYQKTYRLKNALKVRNNEIKKAYGITFQDYERMLAEQNGVCWICEEEDPHGRLAIDHCHITKKIRGLLCRNCNRALGAFRDDIKRLQKAIDYINKHTEY